MTLSMLRTALNNPVNSLLGLSGILALGVVLAAMLIGNPVLVSGSISASFLLAGGVMARSTPMVRDMGAATALIGQAIAFTAAFQAHPWQLDSHMLFFALLACTVVLNSVPALLTATAVTALHHLSFSVLMPTLVFPGTPDLIINLERTVFHAVIVLMETAVLVATVFRVKTLNQQMANRNIELQTSASQALQASEEADRARTSAEAAQAAALKAQAKAEDLLQEAKRDRQKLMDAEQEREATNLKLEQQRAQEAQQQAEVVKIIRHAFSRLQNGDLTTRIDSALPAAYGDLRTTFNEALITLETLVSQVATQAEEMKEQVAAIASSSHDLALRTERQAQTLTNSTTALKQLTKTVQETDETVQEAYGLASTAEDSARSSEAVVSETSQAMTSIQTDSQEISNIVKVIDEISFQTNLLALNAGVEAARAGEAGRGFAVVASEVRDLAQRSSSSATDIRGLIERSGSQVETGSVKIQETVKTLSNVIAAVFEFSARIEKISKGARAQSDGIEDLNGRIGELEVNTQRNAALFEETSAACATLEQGATALSNMTASFKLSHTTPAASKAA